MMDTLPAAPSPQGLPGPTQTAPVPTLVPEAGTFPDPRAQQFAEALRRISTARLPGAARTDPRSAMVAMQAARMNVPTVVATHATVMRMALQLLPPIARPRVRQTSLPRSARAAAVGVADVHSEQLGLRPRIPAPRPTHRNLLAAFARNGIAPNAVRASIVPDQVEEGGALLTA